MYEYTTPILSNILELQKEQFKVSNAGHSIKKDTREYTR